MATMMPRVAMDASDEKKMKRKEENNTLELLYKPHVAVFIIILTLILFCSALKRTDGSADDNLSIGACFVVLFFLIFSMLSFPHGPFTRPHPAIWRIVFGLSVLYFLLLVFLLFQSFQDVRSFISWLYPDLRYTGPDNTEYAVNCSDLTLTRLWESMDVFVVAHLLGWTVKALLLRHYGICWTISIMWEFSEVAFAHLLPNFNECWWDTIILDVLLCNGLGICIGMYLCRKLEMCNHHWESTSDIHSTTGKIRRAVLQFTPATWTHGSWLDRNSSLMRVLAVSYLVIIWNLAELNTFFLKHIFYVPPSHTLNSVRLALLSLVSAPSIRQYYSYVTDTQCSRLGPQCWMFLLITFTESVLCFKFGAEMFRQLNVAYVVIWLFWQVFMSVLCLYISIWLAHKWKTIEEAIETEFDAFQVRLHKRRYSRRTRSLSDTQTNGHSDMPRYMTTNGYHTSDALLDHSHGLVTGGVHLRKVT